MAAVDWGLSDASSPIRNIIPKEGLVWNAGAFRKDGSTWKPKQTAEKSDRQPLTQRLQGETGITYGKKARAEKN
jgi:hypothetical protein